jgi:hypothetical protein
MYRSGDVLAHFKGVCAFLETVVQHDSRQKKRQYIALVKYARTL